MENEKKVGLSINPEIAMGKYSNLAIITHSVSEFIIDFAANLPGLPGPQVNNRVIMTPEHAKRLMFALSENVNKYESNFGAIKLAEQAPQGSTLNINDINPGGTKS